MAREIAFYKNIVKNMQEGVMTLDGSGSVTMYNRAAEAIFGIPAQEVVDRPFGSYFMMELEGNDQFNQAILDAVYDKAMGRASEVRFTRPDKAVRFLTMATSYLTPDGDAPKEEAGVIVVFNDVTDTVAAREKEKALNQKLRKAFTETAETNRRLESALKKVQVIRLLVTFLVIACFAGAGYHVWNTDVLPGSLFTRTPPSANAAQARRLIPVRKQHLSSSVSLSGRIAPLEEINVIAPFDGKIREKFFVYDQQVKKGQLLLTMDTGRLEAELRDARAAFIRARQKFRELAAWEKNSEVSSARRSFTKAKNSRDAAERKVAETRALFDKGIVAASELESVTAALVNQELDFTAAREQLDGVLEKGGREYRELARLELANARMTLEETQQKLEMADLKSPVTGIVTLPITSGAADAEAKPLEPGASVSQGAALVSVCNLDGLSVKASVDEIDVGKIQYRQTVTVSGDAFADIPMTGQVAHISANAVSDGNAQTPMFDVGVKVETLTPDQRKRVKLGMSTNLEIRVYDNPHALLVPLGAVSGGPGGMRVTIEDPGTGALKPMAVTTGMTTLDAVEVLTGLSEGDRVLLP